MLNFQQLQAIIKRSYVTKKNRLFNEIKPELLLT